MNQIATGVRLLGWGHHAPPREISSASLETRLGLESGWIERRTGIRSRRWASAGETLCDLAFVAARKALHDADPAQFGLLLLATSTPDRKLPPTAPLLAHKLGLSHAGAVDIAGACTGFIQALALADGFVRLQKRSALVVAANILSRRIDHHDRASAALFADAAGAVALAPSSNPSDGVIGLDLACNGAGYDLVGIPDGGTTMRIHNGRELFAEAVRLMTTCGQGALDRAGMTASAITRFVPHQANARIINLVRNNLGIDIARTVTTIADFGNSSAASIPFSLSVSFAAKQQQPGEVLLMTAAGAGMVGGGLIFQC